MRRSARVIHPSLAEALEVGLGARAVRLALETAVRPGWRSLSVITGGSALSSTARFRDIDPGVQASHAGAIPR